MKESAKQYENALKSWEEGPLAKAKAKARPRPEPGLLARSYDPPDLFGPDDLEAIGFDPLRDLGMPGEPPYTRGVQPNMYRGRYWTMRQYAGFGTAKESNERYRYLLAQGQTGLSVAFDLPTQMGIDSDSPRAAGEVGRVGVAIDSIEDMRVLLDGVPQDRVSTSMTINSTAAVLLCLYIAVAEEKGIARNVLRGTIQNDILKEYIARGTYVYPPRPSLRLISDIFAFCGAEVPKWNTISISGYHMREAGCDAAQEIAFTLANGLEYVKTAVSAGLDVNAFGEQLSFFFNGHNNFLEEIAKFRAARRLWSTYMKERFGATSPRARALRFHCQTAGATLTAQQPHNNAVRVAIQALAAVLGGCQSLHTNSFDEALGLPTQQSATIALRTQQIIAHETGVADFVDALAGSYAVESLTHTIEREAKAYIERIDELGGAVAAIEQGYIQREIQSSAYQYQLDIEQKRRIIVGQNDFISDTEAVPILKVDPKEEQAQAQRLRAFRARRDETQWAASLQRIDTVARGSDNLVPPILEAVKVGATVGEISDALRGVWGEFTEVLTI
ncbi:MAG TPA: methylmalonyl-CoA mutase family protein [Polyangiaceae bacterium]|jgi:methylmalonyl-CoA mutase N-terminal domain/subunit|nr:MAG: Methylmalonyl-CoA mutase [Deltaproteobacteria bacterium ADurb.Bin207]HNS97343.1 methylmalonyl-CoA mutase family protein [Polyangiaceae bacterium]HNZ21769.1 methylmalonyl-CoA mutase family protein [Polyangiaceae bacterium]HOD25024.1 methylmalonyl-CoA mutase family protein [Polyangiaceae bacterium]HOE51360.1 methylmalonyl-CoA mutase family protein [Polyangiaceae bacterium]